eukprot:4031592-Pyramimonas_sp.AAC.1
MLSEGCRQRLGGSRILNSRSGQRQGDGDMLNEGCRQRLGDSSIFNQTLDNARTTFSRKDVAGANAAAAF